MALVANGAVAGPNGGTTAAVDTTGATFLVAFVAGIGTRTVSDSKTNTWVPLTDEGGTDPSGRLFYVTNPTVGTGHTFTVSGTSIFATLCVQAHSGVDIVSPHDQEAVGGSGSGWTNANAQPGSITPPGDGYLIVAGFGTAIGTPFDGIDSGLTITNEIQFAGGNNYAGAMAYVYQTTGAPINPLWDFAGTQAGSLVGSSFEPGGAAAPAGLTADQSALAALFSQFRRQLPVWLGSWGAASFAVVNGVADGSFGGTFEALGVDRAVGQAVASFGGTFEALGVAGTPPVTGQAVATFGGTFTALGVPRTSGVAVASFGGTFTAAGVDRALGVAVATFGFTATALGVDRAVGQAVASFGGTFTAAGVPRTPGVAVAAFGFTATASGFAGTPPVTGQAVATFGGTYTALGIDRAVGVAVASFGFTATSSGHQLRTGQASATFGFTATALGRPRVHGQATATFGFVAAIFIITYQVRVVAVGGPRYTAVAINRYTGAADGPRYSVED